jgi:hypothetical protein
MSPLEKHFFEVSIVRKVSAAIFTKLREVNACNLSFLNNIMLLLLSGDRKLGTITISFKCSTNFLTFSELPS